MGATVNSAPEPNRKPPTGRRTSCPSNGDLLVRPLMKPRPAYAAPGRTPTTIAAGGNARERHHDRAPATASARTTPEGNGSRASRMTATAIDAGAIANRHARLGKGDGNGRERSSADHPGRDAPELGLPDPGCEQRYECETQEERGGSRCTLLERARQGEHDDHERRSSEDADHRERPEFHAHRALDAPLEAGNEQPPEDQCRRGAGQDAEGDPPSIDRGHRIQPGAR